MSSELWMKLLNEAVQAHNAQSWNGKGGIKKVAEQLGISRSTLSLVLSGQYIASTKHVAQKVLQVLSRVQCPHLQADISQAQCIDNRTRTAPTSSPREMKLWRACQACSHNTQNENNLTKNPVNG